MTTELGNDRKDAWMAKTRPSRYKPCGDKDFNAQG